MATIASGGIRKLPRSTPVGVTVVVVASSSAVTLQNSAGTHVVTIDSGACAELIATTVSTWKVKNFSTQGIVALPLDGWREISSNDIINAAGNGGVLATDTTPTLETVNGDTDGQLRMLWAANNADPVARQITLPADLDRSQPIVLNIRAITNAANDTPVIDIDTFFDQGDTKVEDATGIISDTVVTESATIAAADIPSTAVTASIEMTPGAHSNDTLAVYATWLTYTKKLLA